jgi:hypothetical protein
VTCIAVLIGILMNVDERGRMRPKMRPQSHLCLADMPVGAIGNGDEGILSKMSPTATRPFGMASIPLRSP